MAPIDSAHRIVNRFAARHLGLITWRAAIDAGLTRHQIQHLLGQGRWLRVLPATYRVAGSPPSWAQTALAACLAGPVPTVASHRTAAALWSLRAPPDRPEVTVPRGASGRMPTVEVHRIDLAAQDRTRRGPLPLTSAARTIVDLCGLLDTAALADAVDAAFDAAIVTPAAILTAARRASQAPGKKGLPALLKVLEPWTDPIRPDSPAEARLLRRLDEWGAPPPTRQHVVRNGTGAPIARLDVAWPERRVAIEYDGSAFHSPRRFEEDESRHAAVEALGWHLLHADRLDLRPGQEGLRHRLRAAFAAARVAA